MINPAKGNVMSVYLLTPKKPATVAEDTKQPQEIEESKQVVLQPETSDEEVVPKQTTEDKDKLTVEINGPLSHIYTNALNLALSKENIGCEISHTVRCSDIQVYAISTESLEDKHSGVANDIFKLAASAKDSPTKQVVVFEGISPKSAKLHKLCMEHKFQIYHSRKSAIEGIVSRLVSQ